MRIGSACVLLAISGVALAVPVAQKEFDQVLKRVPDVSHGAALYETCAACHGKNGEGVSDGTVPVIAGQSFNVLAKQIVDFRVGLRGDPRMAHFTASRHLAFSQHIADVAAYIATLPPPKPKAAPPSGKAAVIYTRSCERCHGAAAEGVEDSLTPRVASQHPEYILRQLDDAAAGRRPTMLDTHGALVRSLTKEELGMLATYLAGLGG
jgi:cytochrome c553